MKMSHFGRVLVGGGAGERGKRRWWRVFQVSEEGSWADPDPASLGLLVHGTSKICR